MARIDALIPTAGEANPDRLRELDAGVLARYVSDARHPWWRRRPCAYALDGRVPDEHVAALLDRIRDPSDTSEVRIALLGILEDREELLPWLLAQTDPDSQLRPAILKARAAQGDLTAVPALATLAIDPWSYRVGEAALDVLVARHGMDAVENMLGTRPEDRIFRVRIQRDDGVIAAFADPDVGVARAACERVIATGLADPETLLDHVITGPTVDARLWAAYALARRGRDVRDLWDAMGRPRIEIAGLDDTMRLAILREYPGTSHTDPRWLVERACVDLPPAPDVDAQLARAAHALDAAGFAPGGPLPIGEVNHTGRGTYHVIELRSGAGSISVCDLGPYVTGEPTARGTLERAGFRWVDEEAVGAIRVTGLPVYYFGDRNALDAFTLLFYWQD